MKTIYKKLTEKSAIKEIADSVTDALIYNAEYHDGVDAIVEDLIIDFENDISVVLNARCNVYREIEEGDYFYPGSEDVYLKYKEITELNIYKDGEEVELTKDELDEIINKIEKNL